MWENVIVLGINLSLHASGNGPIFKFPFCDVQYLSKPQMQGCRYNDKLAIIYLGGYLNPDACRHGA